MGCWIFGQDGKENATPRKPITMSCDKVRVSQPLRAGVGVSEGGCGGVEIRYLGLLELVRTHDWLGRSCSACNEGDNEACHCAEPNGAEQEVVFGLVAMHVWSTRLPSSLPTPVFLAKRNTGNGLQNLQYHTHDDQMLACPFRRSSI